MADSSKDILLRELKDMVAELKNLIKTLQETVDAANERETSLTQARDNLKEELRLLRQKLFGTSSEKRPSPPKEQNLFNEAEKEQDPAAAEAEEMAASLPEKRTKKRTARAVDAERYKGIPVTKEYLNLEDTKCPVCGAGLVSIGEDFVRRAQTKSYMWLFRSGEDDGPPIILYKYSEIRSGNTAAEFLDGFHGYLMCDGY